MFLQQLVLPKQLQIYFFIFRLSCQCLSAQLCNFRCIIILKNVLSSFHYLLVWFVRSRTFQELSKQFLVFFTICFQFFSNSLLTVPFCLIHEFIYCGYLFSFLGYFVHFSFFALTYLYHTPTGRLFGDIVSIVVSTYFSRQLTCISLNFPSFLSLHFHCFASLLVCSYASKFVLLLIFLFNVFHFSLNPRQYSIIIRI